MLFEQTGALTLLTQWLKGGHYETPLNKEMDDVENKHKNHFTNKKKESNKTKSQK